jgi:hypothetical protein
VLSIEESLEGYLDFGVYWWVQLIWFGGMLIYRGSSFSLRNGKQQEIGKTVSGN